MDREQQPMKTILVVCTGNSCRSPMAAGWLNHKLCGRGWRAESAGLAAWEGAPAAPEAVEVMREIGVDISGHRSRPLTNEIAAAADWILTMTADQRRQIEQRFPAARGKTRLLTSFGPGPAGEVADPIGLPLDVYRHTRDEMIRGLGDFLLELAESGQWRPSED